MRRRIIDVSTLPPLRRGRARRVGTLSATPAEIAIARQMAERERRERDDEPDDDPDGGEEVAA